MTANTAAIISTNTACVTRAPPILSASQPPIGRASAPTSGPKNTYLVGSTSGNWPFTSSGKPAEKPMQEPKVPMYSQHISQLCLRLKITAWSANEALAEAMSFMPNQAAIAATAMKGTQTKPALCSQMDF